MSDRVPAQPGTRRHTAKLKRSQEATEAEQVDMNTANGRKGLGEGGTRQKRSSAVESRDDDPALQKENRQAVKNQGKAKPEDYPDRGENPV